MTQPETPNAAFVEDNTTPRPVPLCPEITLRLADEALPLWTRTEEALGRMGLPPPFWAFAWAGGQALARYVLDNPPVVRGRAVLDLGAGSGLVAIAAMAAGAQRVLAADPDRWAIAAIGLNARLNGVEVSVTCEDVLEGSDRIAARFGTILVGDLFYEREVADRLFPRLAAWRAAGATVLIGDPGRSYLPKDRLVRIAEYGVPQSRELEDMEIKRTAVWRLA
ncbi:50S ribosomal protein L11 methyltransferase [Microbaculum marinum]|uniref:50S ribosomal protein L11 methyltransferase n=1 Tax=Microbaculum marinum TaxID=1764581 RepID=A0AAW9S5L5_9HYPH